MCVSIHSSSLHIGAATLLTASALATVAWGSAIQVPGTAGLGPSARVASVSCPSTGNCTAGGSYSNTGSTQQAYVVDEHNGVWGNAQEVPGTASLNLGGTARVDSISCASAGNCAAGGIYNTSNSDFAQQAFLVEEHNGVWGTAKEVPGTAALNSGGQADLTSVSCASVGNCAAGGQYLSVAKPVAYQAFVVDERNGVWGTAKIVPGTKALNVARYATVESISCASAGNCAMAGQYATRGATQVFVAREVNGVWGTAKGLPAVQSLNTGGSAQFGSISCATAGNCAAGGYYSNTISGGQAFVATMKGGVWSAKQVPGTAALNVGRGAGVNSVSCATAGNCTAIGYYSTNPQHTQAFVVAEKQGVWGNAKKLLGTTGINDSGGYPSSVSCASAGNCVAAGSYGSYIGATPNLQVFVAAETNGVWGTANEVPGTAALNVKNLAEVSAVSCAKLGRCVIGGYYNGWGGLNVRAFVTSP